MSGAGAAAPGAPARGMFAGEGSRAAVAVVAAALLLRLAWILAVPAEPVSDFQFYYGQAINIAAGKGYVRPPGVPMAYWPVGYPAFLGAVFFLFGPSLLAAKVCNLLLHGLTLWLAFDLARRIFGDARTAVGTAAILGFSPNLVAYAGLLASENLFMPLMLGAVRLALEAGESNARRHAVAAGVLWGLASLTRSYALALPVLLGAVLVAADRGALRAVARQTLVACAAMLLTLAPWTIRNTLAFGRVVLVSTNGGVNLFIGNNPDATGTYVFTDAMRRTLGDPPTELERDRRAKRAALAHIVGNPGHVLATLPRKLWYSYWHDSEGIGWNQNGVRDPSPRAAALFYAAKVLSEAYYLAVVAAAGLWLLRRRARPRSSAGERLGLWLVAYFSAICVVFYGDPRYRFPIMPFLAMYAAAALSGALVSLRARRSGGSPPAWPPPPLPRSTGA